MDEVGMELNRRLAGLLGWTELFNAGGAWLGRPPGGSQKSRDQAKVPDWTGDWAACGPLLSRYVRRLRAWPHRVVIGVAPSGPAEHDLMFDRRAGESADQLLQRAVVAAVAAHLEASR
jgi:hypothetical protein